MVERGEGEAVAADAVAGEVTLPFTGLNAVDALVAAGMFLALGGAALAASRRRDEEQA